MYEEAFRLFHRVTSVVVFASKVLVFIDDLLSDAQQPR